jgi:DNA-binding NarL/FixJ family response regulator
VIILTTYNADNLVFEGIKAVAGGYLLQDATGETLVEAIKGVMEGESWLDPGVSRKVLEESQRLATQPSPTARIVPENLILEPLTRRVEQVLHLLAEGLPNRETSARLHLTEGTVRN